ncbi:MAG: oxygenase MpaB family protein [Mycobacteriales bacterium]
MTDLGLYGPDSVTWRVHSDPIMALAGPRALLLQALQPEAMAGVAGSSGFKEDPWGRLHRTAEYVGVTTFGTTAEAEQAGARVRRIHHRLGLDDPHLLLWVHCTEVESFLTTVTRCGLRLTGQEKDRYYLEQVANARLVGLETAPTNRAAMAEYFRSMRPELQVTPAARQAARFVLSPPLSGRMTALKPAWFGLAGLSIAMLPRWARRMYRLPGLPMTDLGATAAGIALRTSLLALPEHLRHGPHYREAQERLAS